MQSAIRRASHAGSWYQQKKQKLDSELESYLSKANCDIKNIKQIKAIIGPHAGYAYSGPTAAWAYKYLSQTKPKRIFLLGPSHHAYFKGCSLSLLNQAETPIGNIKIDQQTIYNLRKTERFLSMPQKNEQAQHSLEMHMPYIRKIYGNSISLIPIIVGDISPQAVDQYGKILAPYFDDDDNLFIISSDFCHWGAHFDYQPVNKNMKIYEFIQKLDHEGIQLISGHNLAGFQQYIEKTSNTICGENPIKILMSIVQQSKQKLQTKFVKYAQSSKVTDMHDSSVSYASSITYVPM